MADRLQLIQDLNLINLLELGQTISTSTREVVTRHSWISATRRYWNSDSRTKTITWIKEVIQRAIPIFLAERDPSFRSLLMSVRQKINLLKITYKSDTDIIIDCDYLVQDLGRIYQVILAPDDPLPRRSHTGLPEPMEHRQLSRVLSIVCPVPPQWDNDLTIFTDKNLEELSTYYSFIGLDLHPLLRH